MVSFAAKTGGHFRVGVKELDGARITTLLIGLLVPSGETRRFTQFRHPIDVRLQAPAGRSAPSSDMPDADVPEFGEMAKDESDPGRLVAGDVVRTEHVVVAPTDNHRRNSEVGMM